jgi:hypothetical protein
MNDETIAFWITHLALLHLMTMGSYYSDSHSTHDLLMTLLRSFIVSVFCSSLLEYWFYGVFVTTSRRRIQAQLFLIYMTCDVCCERLSISDQVSLICIALEFHFATSTCFGQTLKMSSNTLKPTH